MSLLQAKILNKVEKLDTKSNLYLFTYFYLLISSANLQPIMILITLMGIAVNWSFLIIPDKIRLLKPQSISISISKLRKKLGTNNNIENIAWSWNSKRLENYWGIPNILNSSFTKKSIRTIPVFLPEKIVGYTVTKVWIDIYCPSKASDPSTKCQTFRQNSRIRYKRENHWSWAHFLTFPIVKERKRNSSGIRRKVFGLFAALYHLEEWLNCHWKSVKVIFRVGGHFLYLLMAEHNNLWVLGFHALQINESVIYWGYIIFWQVQIFLKYENVKKKFEQFEFAM